MTRAYASLENDQLLLDEMGSGMVVQLYARWWKPFQVLCQCDRVCDYRVVDLYRLVTIRDRWLTLQLQLALDLLAKQLKWCRVTYRLQVVQVQVFKSHTTLVVARTSGHSPGLDCTPRMIHGMEIHLLGRLSSRSYSTLVFQDHRQHLYLLQWLAIASDPHCSCGKCRTQCAPL